MAKRGRKSKNDKNGYFYNREEEAIIKYINSDDLRVKNEIYNTILHPAFCKMVESIIRKYKLYVVDEDFVQTFNDTISYLLTKINNFKESVFSYDEIEEEKIPDETEICKINRNEVTSLKKYASETTPLYIEYVIGQESKYYKKYEKHYKAYSYCGTICKHYLIQKNIQLLKERNRTISYDYIPEEISNLYPSDGTSSYRLAEKLIKKTSNGIKNLISNDNTLSDNEILVGTALSNLLDNWETILIADESNKLQKSSILYYLKEATMMSTKEIRDNLKPFKEIYYLFKKKEMDDE